MQETNKQEGRVVNQEIVTKTPITPEEINQTRKFYKFNFPCPHCKKIIKAKDFAENDFVIAHLQSYFQSQENTYKTQLLQELAAQPANFPPYQMLLAEKEKLQLLVEGYRLGTTRTSKAKGEDLEKYILEQLQTTYNGADDINRITHVGTKADISQLVHDNNQQTAGKIIYEIKNEGKWDPKWLDKLEKDMVQDKADFGILVATCRRGSPIWKPTPQQNILVSDDENFVFASQMARLLIFSKLRIKVNESPIERMKKWEEWMKEKLPAYLLKLEKSFNEWEKDISRINTSVKNMEKVREEMRKTMIEQLEIELKSI